MSNGEPQRLDLAVEVNLYATVQEAVEKIGELRAENERLRASLADINEAARVTMDEECTKGERHCTCVPLLRREAIQLLAVLDAAKEVFGRAAVYYQAGDEAVRVDLEAPLWFRFCEAIAALEEE